MRAARVRCAALEALEVPTPQDLAEEATTRRHLAKLEEQAATLAQALDESRDAHRLTAAGLEAAMRAREVARLEAEWQALEADAVAFDLQFRERLATCQRGMDAQGHRFWPVLSLNAKSEEALSVCIQHYRDAERAKRREAGWPKLEALTL